MELRLLHFVDGCPGWEKTREHFDVTQQPTLPEKFYGSPTVNYRTRPEDVWQDLFGMTGESVMACRPYRHAEQTTPYIPKVILKERLQEIQSEESD